MNDFPARFAATPVRFSGGLLANGPGTAAAAGPEAAMAELHRTGCVVTREEFDALRCALLRVHERFDVLERELAILAERTRHPG